jgi:hypothetical protein
MVQIFSKTECVLLKPTYVKSLVGLGQVGQHSQRPVVLRRHEVVAGGYHKPITFMYRR